VRRALGDDGTAQQLVRTFTRKGIRFVGEVTELPDQTAPISDRPSIVVLPFENMSADPDQEYFVDGMVEEIITALSRFPRLVRSASSWQADPLAHRPLSLGVGNHCLCPIAAVQGRGDNGF
jgi:hypothetical protein